MPTLLTSLTKTDLGLIALSSNCISYECLQIPASLHVSTELYSCRTWSSRSFNMRSQIMLTWRKVKIGMSFLFGERALNSEVDEDPEGRSSSDDWEVDSWGGDILGGLGHPGYCNCFLLCILFISRLRFEAICSARMKYKRQSILEKTSIRVIVV